MRALTDEQKQEADRLRLTYTEMSVALSMHTTPEAYARHKAEMKASREAFDAKVAAGMAEYMQRSGHGGED